ncbi:MAG: hypothetical protein ACI86H_002348 [bacterium]|jgi:hypothetical protein
MSTTEKKTKTFDPSYLNDSIAIKTKWSPVKVNVGSLSRNYILVKTSSSCFEVHPSKSSKVIHLIICLIFLSLSVAGFIKLQMDAFSTGTFIFDPEGFGILGACFIGSIVLLYFLHPYTYMFFDRKKKLFWKGGRKSSKASKKSANINEIHAIQLLSKLRPGTGRVSSFYSYELNLVLNNGKRINVIDHAYQDHVRADAKTLASFLKTPVWDAIGRV